MPGRDGGPWCGRPAGADDGTSEEMQEVTANDSTRDQQRVAVEPERATRRARRWGLVGLIISAVLLLIIGA